MTIGNIRGIAGLACAALALAAGVAGARDLGGAAGDGAHAPVAISACGDITAPGRYVLTRDVEAAPGKDCMRIFARDVTLDLGGHTISTARGGRAAGINANAASADDVAVVNGVISGFWVGAVMKSGTIERVTIEDVENGVYLGSGAVLDNAITAGHTGIQVHSARVEGNLIDAPKLSLSCSLSCLASGNVVRGGEKDDAMAEAARSSGSGAATSL